MTEATDQLAPPVPLTHEHDTASFDSGVQELDDWLRRRALANQETGASRTYVVCQGNRVAGYYCLCAGSVSHGLAPGKVRRNMPNPVPVMLLGRLAVDRRWQGRGMGRGMLLDAILRTLEASQIGGIRAMLVHAISAEARDFYERCGFVASPIEPMTLMITLAEARAALQSQ